MTHDNKIAGREVASQDLHPASIEKTWLNWDKLR